MTGENLEQKVQTKEILTKDIVKNFGLFAAVASDPNDKIKVGDDKIGVYGISALSTVLKNVSDETKEYLAPIFARMEADYKQNKEFSPYSKHIFKDFSNIYNSKIVKARAIDVIKLAEEYGLKKDDVAKQLHENYSFKELAEKYMKDIGENGEDFEPKTEKEFQAHAVLKSIEYINEYIKANAKGKIWDEAVASYIKEYKDMAENPAEYIKAEAEKNKSEIVALQNRIKELHEKK